jgi:hypothetical protein
MARWTINTYNLRIDRSKTVQFLGKNGIHYEYVMPIFSQRAMFYEQALDVKSRKSPTTRYKNGKKPGQYQPVGDKRFFNFYQMNKMSEEDKINFILEKYGPAIIAALVGGE